MNNRSLEFVNFKTIDLFYSWTNNLRIFASILAQLQIFLLQTFLIYDHLYLKFCLWQNAVFRIWSVIS